MANAGIFSLDGKGLKLDTAADIEPHIQSLRERSSIVEVRFGGNTLGVGACEALADVLKTKKDLQIANLADIFTSRLLHEIPLALTSLIKALLTLPSLHTVDLSDNAFGLNTQAPLVEFLSQHAPLRHLYLNNNGLGPKAGVLVGDALTKLHAKKEEAKKAGNENIPHLETIICGRNRLESGSMAAWAKTYAAHKNVKTVKMVQNGIRQDGITLLLREGLRHATELRVLDLQDNTFTVQGARALAGLVPGWEELVELGVGDCFLTARGGVVLAEALAKGSNQKLETLRLQYNDINGKGLNATAHAVSTALPALKRVEINGNKLDEEDPNIGKIRSVLEDRKEGASESADNAAKEDEWGLDDLSDLEEESGEESDEEDEEQEDEDHLAERKVKEDEQAEDENVPQENDKSVDDLAEKLGKTGL